MQLNAGGGAIGKDRESLWLAVYYLLSSARIAEMARFLQKNVNRLCEVSELDRQELIPPAAIEEITQAQRLHRRLRQDELTKYGAGIGAANKPPPPTATGADGKSSESKSKSRADRAAGGAGGGGRRGATAALAETSSAEDGLTSRALLYYYLSLRNMQQFGGWFERGVGSSTQDVIHPTSQLIIQLHNYFRIASPLYAEKCVSQPVPVRTTRALGLLSAQLAEAGGTNGLIVIQWRNASAAIVPGTDISKPKRVEQVEMLYAVHRTSPATVSALTTAEEEAAAAAAAETAKRGGRSKRAAATAQNGGTTAGGALSPAVGGAPPNPLGSPGASAAPDFKRITSTAAGGPAVTPTAGGGLGATTPVSGGVTPSAAAAAAGAKKSGRRGGRTQSDASAALQTGPEPDINLAVLNTVTSETFAVGARTVSKSMVLAACGVAAALKTRIGGYAGRDRDITPADRKEFAQLLASVRSTLTGAAPGPAPAGAYEPVCSFAVISALERVFDNSAGGGVIAVSPPVAALLASLF